MPSQHRAVERQTSFWLWVVIVAGTAIYLWLLSRSWVGRDQIILLNLGQGFALTGTLHPVAKGMSGGGMIPGSLLEILIGGPLMIWQDYRAPLIPIAIFALLAGVSVYRVAKVQMGSDAALIYFLLYWLSPWRLTHAAMMWEPAFLFLPAALHLWAVSRLTPQPGLPTGSGRLWPSIVLGGVLLLTPQLHGSFLFLWLLTAILIYKKKIRLDWRGAALGAAIGSLTLIPAIYAAATNDQVNI